MSDVDCSSDTTDAFTGLRIASVFIIMATSMFGALFPVVAKRTRWGRVIPEPVFDFAKYFGSGVIIATGFIHLLSPALDELGSPCLAPEWTAYPWPLALCMLSIFSIFFVELFAFRWGTARLEKLGIGAEPHVHYSGKAVAEETEKLDAHESSSNDLESAGRKADYACHGHEPDGEASVLDSSATAQVLGIAILEFGVLFHSFLIGLTLAVTSDFTTLFIVIIFHQMFEGLGVGSRLAYLKVPKEYNWIAIAGALVYGLTTPIGIAVGLGIRSSYNENGVTANIVSGIFDSLSSGILLYTGLVELLAHEFLFNKDMNRAPLGKLIYACVCMLVGAGLMSLLGEWA